MKTMGVILEMTKIFFTTKGPKNSKGLYSKKFTDIRSRLPVHGFPIPLHFIRDLRQGSGFTAVLDVVRSPFTVDRWLLTFS